MKADPKAYEGRKMLFVHTGGLLGMYDKVDQLQPMVEALGNVSRFPVGDVLDGDKGGDADMQTYPCERIVKDKGCEIQ
eukprot:3553264-Pyramimonas_sp.AAC.1